MVRRCLIVGRSVLDISWISQDIVAIDKQIFTDDIGICPGGSGINVTYSATRLFPNIVFVSKIGSDKFGEILLSLLKQRNFDTSGMRVAQHALTSVSLINVNTSGQLGIVQRPGANELISIDDVDIESLDRYSHVHVAGTFLLPRLDGAPTAKVFSKAKALGLTTSLSVTRNTQFGYVLTESLPNLDFLFLNSKEILEITGCSDLEAAAKKLLLYTQLNIVVTDGAGGAYFFSNCNSLHIPALPVMVKDTTGCGDAFAGIFLACYLKGYATGICMRYAGAGAAHTARVAGAIPSSFDEAQIGAMLRINEIHPGLCCLVLAGGKGSRMQIDGSKLLIDLNGKPVLGWTVETLIKAGVPRVILLLGHFSSETKQLFREAPVEFVECEQDYGTGGVLLNAVAKEASISDHFCVVNGDTPLITEKALTAMIEGHFKKGNDATLLTSTSTSVSRYKHGLIERTPDGEFDKIRHFSEYAGSDDHGEVNTGTYCFRKEAFMLAAKHASWRDGVRLHLSDVFTAMKKEGLKVGIECVDDFSQFISVNDQNTLADVGDKLKERNSSP